MRVLDYLRLGFAGVKAHKKRAFAIVAIVGLLFGVVMAGAFVLQGLKNAAFAEMLEPTGGRVLVMSSVDTRICKEDCDITTEVAEMKKNVEKYGGKVVAAEMNQTADGVFYKLDGVFDGTGDDVDGVAQVVVPLEMAAKVAGVEMPGYDATLTVKLQAIERVREETLRKVVESKTGEKYYIAGILPGGVYAYDLSFRSVGQNSNPLDLIFGQVWTGVSQSFVAGGDVKNAAMATEEAGLVFAQFADIEAAYDYYRDRANYCSEMDQAFGSCSKDYKYQVMSAISDPFTTYDNLQNVWLVFKIAAAVLVVIAVIIALSTYARLIGKDGKIISLYHAMGATGWQIRVIYAVYLLVLSVMAIVFAVVIGLVLAAVLSLANMTALGQVFALSFGAAGRSIWLIGWNEIVWWLVGVMMITAVVAVMISNGSFRVRELAKTLK